MMESVLLLYNVVCFLALLLGLFWRHKFEPVVRKGDCRWRDTYKEAGGGIFPLHVNKAVAL